MEVESSTPWRFGSNQPVCRCCLAEGCYKDISTEYFWMGKREVYSEMLLETFDVNIGFAASGGINSSSRHICEPCIGRLRDASEFKRQVLDCEKAFMQQLEQDIASTSVLEIEATSSEKPVKTEVKLEKADSDDDDDNVFGGGGGADDDDDDDLDDEPLTKFATKVPKKETVDILELLDEPKPQKRKTPVKVKVPVKKVKVTKKESPKASSSKASTTKAVEKPEKKRRDENLNDRARRNAELVLRYTTAYPFRVNVKSLLCVYCLELFEDPAQFRRHMDAEHDKFSSMIVFSKLPKAEFVKADLTDLRCRICNQKYSVLDEVAAHLRDAHEKDIQTDSPLGMIPYLLEKQTWKCAVCSKTLPSLLHLNRHTVTHYLGFVCDICGKSYLASTGLLRHIKLNHDQDGATLCRLCNKSFESQEAKNQHQKIEKRCMPHRCTMCVERFPTWELKQRHMAEGHGQRRMQYQCPECGVSCVERRAFYNHYRITHSQEWLGCVHCGLKFATASRLKRHLGKHAV